MSYQQASYPQPQPQPQQTRRDLVTTGSTWYGIISTPREAYIVLEASRLGILARMTRRLTDLERAEVIRPGAVFVWEEKEAGIKRWTDHVRWSPSRVSGAFLIYSELMPEAADPNFSSQDALYKQSFSSTTTHGEKLHLIAYYSKAALDKGSLPTVSQDSRLNKIVVPMGVYPDHRATTIGDGDWIEKPLSSAALTPRIDQTGGPLAGGGGGSGVDRSLYQNPPSGGLGLGLGLSGTSLSDSAAASAGTMRGDPGGIRSHSVSPYQGRSAVLQRQQHTPSSSSFSSRIPHDLYGRERATSPPSSSYPYPDSTSSLSANQLAAPLLNPGVSSSDVLPPLQSLNPSTSRLPTGSTHSSLYEYGQGRRPSLAANPTLPSISSYLYPSSQKADRDQSDPRLAGPSTSNAYPSNSMRTDSPLQGQPSPVTSFPPRLPPSTDQSMYARRVASSDVGRSNSMGTTGRGHIPPNLSPIPTSHPYPPPLPSHELRSPHSMQSLKHPGQHTLTHAATSADLRQTYRDQMVPGPMASTPTTDSPMSSRSDLPSTDPHTPRSLNGWRSSSRDDSTDQGGDGRWIDERGMEQQQQQQQVSSGGGMRFPGILANLPPPKTRDSEDRRQLDLLQGGLRL